MIQEAIGWHTSWGPWIIGLLGSLLVAGAAWWKKSLTGSGAAAAIVMGTIYCGSGGLIWFGSLLTFFVTSTLWSKWKKRAKGRFEDNYEKSGTRDAGQVFANGGLGLLLCLAYIIAPHPAWVALFVGAMASVNADTWATEIGSLSRRPPRSIVTGRVVPPGTSGGVSLLGTTASAAGAFVIGAAAAVFLLLDPLQTGPETSFRALAVLLLAGTLGGLAGALLDSLLGATLQAGYRCPQCGADTERTSHCGSATKLVRGYRWLNNDRVNLLCSCAGAAVSCLIWLLAGG
ncbi:DUF92 domain-containing protein [Paenibacillus thiaminolyticus]|uniref:DUF92 domain-containing protein n=1 Tax=Paenibacillus thiaminolyticus TaxID=49283 RepID=UPI00116507CF|nr:DUF92 domain-containing protein [Paenibacillus thiaminolyticus]MDG0874688.1 DUF92 domain-containing protein [Paenibacillus thiaminolyticus]NGP57506.1 DUF92 domain-containing protein [Paenibacillus thiaminolyticus]WCR27300.1 DUF92 domain-containing protein [Paenibacillus thiaminolyticus]